MLPNAAGVGCLEARGAMFAPIIDLSAGFRTIAAERERQAPHVGPSHWSVGVACLSAVSCLSVCSSSLLL